MNENNFALCGLSCSTCAIYQAHTQDDNQLQKIALAIYRKTLKNTLLSNLSLEDIRCEGCRSEVRFKYCQACDIRTCCSSQGYYGCYQCKEFPCRKIKDFPIGPAKSLMFEAAEYCKKAGPESWLERDRERYTCRECSTLMYRGATRCKNCKVKLNGKIDTKQ